MSHFIEGFAEEAGGVYSGRHDFVSIFCVVTAVDIAAGEINQNVRVVQFVGPIAWMYAIPLDSSPWSGTWATSEDHDGVPFRLKMPGEQISHLTVTAWDYDSNW